MNRLDRCKPLLGTYVEISLSADLSDADLMTLSNQAFTEISNVQSVMSFHDSDSELSKLNLNAITTAMRLSESMLEIFNFIDELNCISNGLFDPSVAAELMTANKLPKIVQCSLSSSDINTTYKGRWGDVIRVDDEVYFKQPLLLDFGGIAKGYAVDKAIASVPNSVQTIVNAGGDIRMSHWHKQKVNVVYKDESSLKTSTLPMQSNAVASSASYYHDNNSVVINPLTRQSIASEKTYSVFAKNCMTADALTKVAWLIDDESSVKLKHILTHFDASLITTS